MGGMSNTAINWCRLKPCPNPTTKLVLILLANYADESGYCYPSERHLAEVAGTSERTVRRCIKALVDLGYIESKQRIGKTNLYHLLGVPPTLATGGRRGRPYVAANTLRTQRKERTQNDIAG